MGIEDDIHEGMAQAHVIQTTEWKTGQYLKTRGRYKLVRVISTDVLMRMMIAKHSAILRRMDVMGSIRDLVHEYMRVRNISQASTIHARLAKGLTIRGFARAVEKMW